MSLPRFFLRNQVLAAQTEEVFGLRLDDEDVKHARVLRLKPGEHIAVIDGSQDYFECEIVAFEDVMHVRISSHDDSRIDRPFVVLFQGLCKGDKMEQVIRHATELGVSAFVPLACERSVVRLDRKKAEARVNRWNSVAKSAAMQSGQPSIPEVSLPIKPNEAAGMLGGATCVLVCWEEERQVSMKEAIGDALAKTFTPALDARVAICIGPEGGFTEQEVKTLCEANRHSYSVTLGSQILRTETAGIVAPALAIYELGGLQ